MGTCPVLCRKCIPSGRAVAVGFVFSYQASNNEASLHAYHMDSRSILPRTFLMENKQVLPRILRMTKASRAHNRKRNEECTTSEILSQDECREFANSTSIETLVNL